MRIILAVLVVISIYAKAHATDEPTVSKLNSELIPIYEQLMTKGENASLIGQYVEAKLHLRHASERFLLFTDTQVVLDNGTNYYLIKWRFEPDDISDFIGKSDVICKVSGRVVEVVSGAKASGMPYVVVELLQLEL